MTTASQTLTARPLTGGLLTLLAALAAIGTLATTIVLPSFSSIATDIDVSVRDLAWLLSSFFAAFALGQGVGTDHGGNGGGSGIFPVAWQSP